MTTFKTQSTSIFGGDTGIVFDANDETYTIPANVFISTSESLHNNAVDSSYKNSSLLNFGTILSHGFWGIALNFYDGTGIPQSTAVVINGGDASVISGIASGLFINGYDRIRV